MRLWNVSKQTPIENLRLKKTGFHALHVFSTAPGRSAASSDLDSPDLPSTGPPTTSATGRYALPPAHAVCTFLDGGVGLYDLGKRRWTFLRDLVSTQQNFNYNHSVAIVHAIYSLFYYIYEFILHHLNFLTYTCYKYNNFYARNTHQSIL